ncbi:Endothelin-converting enzyme 1 [Spironucleus salmonicida]|uniref:Endothelin-converting enzyme 1 n=1 Tax=Spironucleus salmonicida TaxID=348837 RepID=V6M028_9EUKA|nr:Endothelin-converting enzyme 1 [Spironucleus salmonicida]|eukprot:EST46474.1 Methyltransferase domain-containing protein [Spironucleus salmonicida]
MYHQSQFWEDRYKQNQQLFDFYCQICQLEEELKEYLIKDAKILIIGAGTSRTPFQLYDQGYKCIKCIDFSKNAVEAVQEHMKTRPEIEYEIQDVTCFKDKFKYDLILDKGCLDCVIASPQSPLDSFMAALEQLYEKLQDNGVIFSITFDSERDELIEEAFPDKFTITIVEKRIEVDTQWGQNLYCFILKKLPKQP